MQLELGGGLSLEALGHLRAEVPSCTDDGGKVRHLQLEALTDSSHFISSAKGRRRLRAAGAHA